VISSEQLRFLKGRQILDSIGTTQECIHSIKARKQKTLILKLDLRKAYNCVNKDFLRLILVQTGFNVHSINWIMSCVVSSSFLVLINGEASSFFTSECGLRQGCPLSPLLFILVMKSISLLLKKGQVKGNITGVKVSRIIKVLHLIFVDDVLIMSKASLDEWKVIKYLLELFCCASSLKVSPQKSTFHFSGIHGETLEQFRTMFSFNFEELYVGFCYLGYHLKADKSTFEDRDGL